MDNNRENFHDGVAVAISISVLRLLGVNKEIVSNTTQVATLKIFWIYSCHKSSLERMCYIDYGVYYHFISL